MKIYGILNDSQELKVSVKNFKAPSEYILMKTKRPTPKHVATNEGEWIISPYLENLEKEEEIFKQLKEIDEKSIRPQRSIESNLGTEEDRIFLIELERKAQDLREELTKLEVQDA